LFEEPVSRADRSSQLRAVQSRRAAIREYSAPGSTISRAAAGRPDQPTVWKAL